MTPAEVAALVALERERQQKLWNRDHDHGWGDCSSLRVPQWVKLAVLLEEVGEVARALLDRRAAVVTTELVQVAAVVQAWLETPEDESDSIDGQTAIQVGT